MLWIHECNSLAISKSLFHRTPYTVAFSVSLPPLFSLMLIKPLCGREQYRVENSIAISSQYLGKSMCLSTYWCPLEKMSFPEHEWTQNLYLGTSINIHKVLGQYVHLVKQQLYFLLMAYDLFMGVWPSS